MQSITMKDTLIVERMREKIDVEGKLPHTTTTRLISLNNILDDATGFTIFTNDFRQGLETITDNTPKQNKGYFGYISLLDDNDPDPSLCYELEVFDGEGMIKLVRDDVEEQRIDGFPHGFPEIKVMSPADRHNAWRCYSQFSNHITAEDWVLQIKIPDKKDRVWIYTILPSVA